MPPVAGLPARPPAGAPPLLEDAPPLLEVTPPFADVTPPFDALRPALAGAPPFVDEAPLDAAAPPFVEPTPPFVDEAPPLVEATPPFVDEAPPLVAFPPLAVAGRPPEPSPPFAEASLLPGELAPPAATALPPPSPHPRARQHATQAAHGLTPRRAFTGGALGIAPWLLGAPAAGRFFTRSRAGPKNAWSGARFCPDGAPCGMVAARPHRSPPSSRNGFCVGAGMARMLAALRESPAWCLIRRRDFGLLWTGETISQIGDGLNKVALLWFAYQTSHSALRTSLIGVLQTVPPLVLGPIIGVYLDRLPKKPTMIVINLLHGVLVALIPLLYGLGVLSLGLLYALVLVISVVSAFYGPALMSALPLVADREELRPANALIQGTSIAARARRGGPRDLRVRHRQRALRRRAELLGAGRVHAVRPRAYER